MRRRFKPVDTKFSSRFPLHPEVDHYVRAMGTMLNHLRGYSRTENHCIHSEFRRIDTIIYKHYRDKLMLKKPSKDAPLNAMLRHNDSVHFMKLSHRRFQLRSAEMGRK